jgi:hypothetical protein
MTGQEQSLNNANQLNSAFCNPLRRFPLPVAIVAALALASVPSLNGGDEQGGQFRTLLQPGLEAAFLWTVAAALWGESRKSTAAAWVAAIAGGAAIFVMFGYPWSIPTYLQGQWTPEWRRFDFPLILWRHNRHSLAFLPFVLFALTLLVGLAPHLRAQSSGEAFWRFNQKLAFAALLALIAAVLLVVGEVSILRSVERHSSFPTPALWKTGDEIVRIASLLFVAPVVWLSMLPTTFDDKPDRNPTQDFALQAITLLVKFVFIPLTLVFSSIIPVYVVMLIAKGAVPQAYFGDGVNWLSLAIVLTALLSYPIRKEERLVRFYWLIWPWLLVTPVACSAVAAYIDIEQHGVTPEQCARMGIALGMAIISSAFLGARSRTDIRLIPGALIATALIGSFGPWGAVAMSTRSQQAIVSDAFAGHGLIKDGRWTGAASTTVRWPDDERRRMLSSLGTLLELDAAQTLASWFEGRNDDPFRGKAPFVRLDRMANLFGSDPRWSDPSTWNDPSTHLSFGSGKSLLLPLENARLLAGPYGAYFSDSGRQRNPRSIETGIAALGTLSLDFDVNALVVLSADGRRASFDLTPTVQSLIQKHAPAFSVQNHVTVTEDKPIILSSSENTLPVQIIITNLDAKIIQKKISLSDYYFYLLIDVEQTATAN